MSFFSSKNKQTYSLSISLKSSSIDLQLICTLPNSKKEVLFVERIIILLENSQDPILYTKQCIKELSLLLKKNEIKIKELTQGSKISIHVILYAPWFTSRITSIEHKELTLVDENFLFKKLTNLKIDSSLHNLEKQVLKIRTNGYKLDTFSNTKCSDVHLSVYSSYISEHIYEMFSKVFDTQISHSKTVIYTTSPLLIFNNIKQYMINEDNITFLYIGGEITEIGVIEDDSLVHYVTFPIGKHDFLREIQSHIVTYDYDVLYQKEIQLKSIQKQKNFDLLKEKWVLSILQSLELFQKNIPNKILIITDIKTKDFFTSAFLGYLKQNPSKILQNTRIINFDISTLKDIISYKTPLGENELDLKLEALI